MLDLDVPVGTCVALLGPEGRGARPAPHRPEPLRHTSYMGKLAEETGAVQLGVREAGARTGFRYLVDRGAG